jgi:hypothetical protein
MSEPSPANLELAIALPLGVVANQLIRIEADLRFLSMKTSRFDERETGQLAGKVAGSLERINEALDLIRDLVTEIQSNIQAASLSRKSSGHQDD